MLSIEDLLKTLYGMLPGRKAKVSFGLSVILAVSFFSLCQYVNIGMMFQLEQAQKISALSGSILLLLLGSWLALLFVSFEFKTQSLLHAQEKATLEDKLELVNQYLEINRVSWVMVESEVCKNENFNIGINKVLKQ